MATLAVTINAGAQSYTNTRTITGPHLTRMIAAYRSLGGQIQDGVDAQGQPIMRDRTDTEVLDWWWSGLVQGTINNVKSYEQAAAAKTASDAVTPIAAT